MFDDELDRIANRVMAGSNKRGYIAQCEDDYSDESDADSVCYDTEGNQVHEKADG